MKQMVTKAINNVLRRDLQITGSALNTIYRRFHFQVGGVWVERSLKKESMLHIKIIIKPSTINTKYLLSLPLSFSQPFSPTSLSTSTSHPSSSFYLSFFTLYNFPPRNISPLPIYLSISPLPLSLPSFSFSSLYLSPLYISFPTLCHSPPITISPSLYLYISCLLYTSDAADE